MATKPTKSPTQTQDAKSLLSSLTAGKKAQPKKSESKPVRPELALDQHPTLKEAFRRFIEAWAVEEIVDQRLVQEKAILNDGCFDIWTDGLWRGKTRPANPSLEIPNEKGQDDLVGLYQVQERYSLNLPQVPEGQELKDVVIEKLTEAFKATGMPDDEAADAASNFVNTELVLGVKPVVDLDRLTNGRWEGTGKNKSFIEATKDEQAIAAKVITLLQARSKTDLASAECLSDEEMSQAVQFLPNVMVKPGFLNRVCSYVKSVDQLRCIFSVVRPTRFPQGRKFGASDTPEEKNRRLAAAFKDMMGS
jgi:hypothetical protein